MIAKLLNPKLIITLAVVIIVGWFAYAYTTGIWQPGQLFNETRYGPTDRLELDYTAVLGKWGLINEDKSITYTGSQWTSDRATTGLDAFSIWDPFGEFNADYYVQVRYTYNGMTKTVQSQVTNTYTGFGVTDQVTINYRVVTPIWQWQNAVDENAPSNEWEYDGSTISYTATLFEDGTAVRTSTGTV